MDKKEFNKTIGKALRAKRTELGGATAGRNGSRAVENITKQLSFRSNRSIYHIENGHCAVGFADFVLYCRAMEMSIKETAEFFEEIIVKVLKP